MAGVLFHVLFLIFGRTGAIPTSREAETIPWLREVEAPAGAEESELAPPTRETEPSVPATREAEPMPSAPAIPPTREAESVPTAREI